MSLYVKYGPVKVSELVEQFYAEVLASDRLKTYFVGKTMQALISHQTKFLCKVLGGPDNYNGRDLINAHAGMNISPEEFAEVAEILRSSLTATGFEPSDIETVIGVVASTESKIVGH